MYYWKYGKIKFNANYIKKTENILQGNCYFTVYFHFLQGFILFITVCISGKDLFYP